MAISLRASRAWTAGAGTPQTVTLPSGSAAGDMMIAYIGAKPYTTTLGVSTAGWAAVPGTAGSNGTTASGIDTGSVVWAAFYKVFEAGDVNVTFTLTGVNVALFTVQTFQKDANASWVTPTGGKGSDTSSGTGFSITSDVSLALKAGDMISGWSSLPGNDATFGTPTLTGTGLTIDTPTEEPTAEGSTATGQDFESTAMYAKITAGSASVAPVMGWTLSAAQTGGGCIVRLSEMTVSVSDTITVRDQTDSTAAYYFDASDAAVSDPNTNWSNDANAFDGNTATSATPAASGDTTTNYLMGEGTTAPTTGTAIVQVRARVYRHTSPAGQANAAIYSNGLAELLGTTVSTGQPGYGSYIILSTPSGGWTWQKVNDLEVKIYDSVGSNRSPVSRVDLEVTYGDASTNVTVSVVSGSSDKSVSVSDTATITESTTLLIPELFINKSESITVTESVQRVLESYVNVSDSITITESLKLLLESLVNVNDSVTVAENLQRLLESYVNKSESITLTEAITVLIPELLLSVNDSITVTESLKLLLESYINKSESITLTENVKAELQSLINVSDSVTITENLVRVLESFVNVNDTATITEALQRVLESYVNKSESITLTENIDLQAANISGTIVPSATEAEIVAGGKTTVITLLGDTWIAAGALSFDLQRQNIINGISSAQSEATGWNLVPQASQTTAGVIRTSDTVVTITWDAFPTYNITAQETITVTVPSTALTSGLAIVASPTFYISTDAFVGTHEVNVSDSITITEAVNLELNSRVSVSDNVTITESVNRLLESYVNKSDSITVTENVDPELQSHVSVSDSITITENINRLLESYINKSENITITEAVTVLETFYNLSVTDSITVTESVNRLLESYVSKSENITLTENIRAELDNNISVSDSITLTENVNRLLESYVNTSDSITITENVSVYEPFYNVNVSDNISLTEALSLLLTSFIAVSDSISISENVRAELNSSVNVSDEITLTESTKTELNSFINVSDEITITENVALSIINSDTYSVNVSDSITVSENVSVSLDAPTLTINVRDIIGGGNRRIFMTLEGDIYYRVSTFNIIKL